MWCSSAIPTSSPVPAVPHRPRAGALGRALIVRIGATLGFLLVMSMSGDTAGLPYTFSGLAGLSLTGSADGTGDAARFAFPQAVAADTAGNVYVADTSNHTIRTITPEGAVSTLAGLAGVAGSTDGTGSAARFNFPAGVAVDSAGNVYVADIGNNTIRTITPAGAVSTLAGLAGSDGSTDGIGSAARFSGPRGVAVDTTGNVYVADFGNSTIRKITPAGMVSTWAGLAENPGSTDAIGNAARFSGPKDVDVDAAGNVYVADLYNSTIRKITPAGAVSTLAGLAVNYGSEDGPGSTARFSFPAGVALDPVRSRLLSELAVPASAATLAARVGLARQKVNYHLNALEAHGLVHRAHERKWGGLTERLLVASAASYVVSPGALGASRPADRSGRSGHRGRGSRRGRRPTAR